MSKRQYERAREIFFAVADLAGAAREEAILARCGDDGELRWEIDSLLAAHDRTLDLLATGGAAEGLVHAVSPEAWIGRRVGAFEIDGVLGRGGMGTVFSAHRVDGPFEQRTAIKILARSVLDSDATARFRREWQMLARLEHPNIAHLIDAGTTEAGVPYLIMEYVDGTPIDEYCERQRLSVPERLDLVRDVCAAVQHAHGRLILHRDIKPSNVLVTHEGHPKLLDFGIAKTLVSDADGLTLSGLGPLTPEYAAPEQLVGDTLTAATDVYQLGVLLYVLLAGRLPFRHTGGHIAALIADVVEHMPPSPSDSVEPTRPAAGTTAPTAPVRADLVAATDRRDRRAALSGDLDEIVLMALRKEPSRRYQSPSELALDLENHVRGRPVRARGGSRAYRVGKFVRRNRVAVAFAALVVVSLAGGLVATLSQSRRASAQAALARREAAKTGAINRFLQDMLASADPARLGAKVTVREVLDRAAAAVDTGFSDPEIRAGLLSTIGQTYAGLGLDREGLRFLDSALVQYERLDLATSRDAFPALASSLSLLSRQRRVDELRERAAAAAPGFEAAYGVDDSTSIVLRTSHAYAAYGAGFPEEAVRGLDSLLPIARRSLGPDAPVTVGIELQLAGVLAQQSSRRDEALALLRHARTEIEKLGPGHPSYLIGRMSTIELLAVLGQTPEAVEVARQVASENERIYGPGHVATLGPRRLLAFALFELRQPDTALAIMRRVYDDARRLLDEADGAVAMFESDLGVVLLSMGQVAEGETHLRNAYRLHRVRDGETAPTTIQVYQNLGEAVRMQGRNEEALEILTEAVRLHQANGLGVNYYFAAHNLAALHMVLGRPAQGLAMVDEMMPEAQRRLPRASRIYNLLVLLRGRALVRLDRVDEAEREYLQVRENYVAERNGEVSHPDVVWATTALAAFYESVGRADESARWKAALAESPAASVGGQKE